MESVIGKRYFSVDGSYSKCLSKYKADLITACEVNNWQPTILTIVSEPFQMVIMERIDKSPLDFVIVKTDKNDFYSIMFEERGLDLKANMERYASNRQMYSIFGR